MFDQGNQVIARMNGDTIMSVVVEQLPSKHGFVALGPDSFGAVYFDNLHVLRADLVKLCSPNERESRDDCVHTAEKVKRRRTV